jgi:hypothetical protein
MAEGFHAYNEFLQGLSKINQEEFVQEMTMIGPDLTHAKLEGWSQVSEMWDLGGAPGSLSSCSS